jgi:hypothetical protein
VPRWLRYSLTGSPPARDPCANEGAVDRDEQRVALFGQRDVEPVEGDRSRFLLERRGFVECGPCAGPDEAMPTRRLDATSSAVLDTCP